MSVRTLQEELHRAGYDTGRIDGRWGPRTQGAFERFWHSSGLSVGLTASANPVLQRFSVATVLWNRLVATSDGAGGEIITSSGARSDSSSTRTSTSTSSRSRATTSDDNTGDGSKWWQSPWLWGGVALAAGAGVVLLATQDNEEGAEDDSFLLELEEN